MERNKIYSPLNDKELVQKAYWWIQELIKSGGKDFIMHVPAQLDHDTDLVFFNLAKRFENLLGKYEDLQEKCEALKKERYETRIVLHRLLKAFKSAKKTDKQEKCYLEADYILDKDLHVDDVLRNQALAGEAPTEQEIEAEITRRWNSILHNPEGIRKRESYREGVIRDLKNKREDKQ